MRGVKATPKNLATLHDVDLDTAAPTDGQALTWDDANSVWVPDTVSGGGSSPLTTKGDLYTYGTADARLPVGSDGQVLTADSAQSLGVKWAAAGGGGSAWTQVVDEDGTSLANWTSVAGTWATNAGGYIEQTDTTAAYRGLRYTSKTPGFGAVAMQAEVRFPSGQPGSFNRALMACGWDGTLSGVHAPWLGIQDGSGFDGAFMQRGDQTTNRATTDTIAVDTWYTVLVVHSGSMVSISLDGTLVASRKMSVGSEYEQLDYVGLVTYQAVTHWRNIKAWRLTVPS